jgi:hypothetical protein
MVEYRTVYSILDDAARVPWSHVVIGLVGAPTAAAFAWRKRDWVMLVFTAGWGLFWNYGILPASWTIYHEHERAQEQLRSGGCEIVEGTVEQFHPMPYHGHALESFTMNGVRFEYSDFDDSKPGFNHTESHGGPIHVGMRARIHHREGSILQIEVPASP